MAKLCRRDDGEKMILLHIGCGPRGRSFIPEMFEGYEEWRMDIDEAVEPDVVGSITDIDMPDRSVDGVFASHILEHVEQWDVHQALCEVRRVLRPGGVALIVVPDLERVAQEIMEHPGMIEMETLAAPFGCAPLDMLFGYQPAVLQGQEYMRHRTAFTQRKENLMAKRQTTDTPGMVLVEALVKMWAADEIVPVGTVYPLPAAAANDLAGQGMVRIIGGDVEAIEAEVPTEAIEAVEVVAFDPATEGENG